jgi:hypothetical protein
MLDPSRQRGALAELLVAYRFLESGRLVSWPLTPCAYDLVVDTGDRLVRVQVKQAHEHQGADRHFGHWIARLTKRRTGGRDRALAAADVDYIAVVCRPEEVYVIPAPVCTSQQDARWIKARLVIGPESHYRVFLNLFSLGNGSSGEVAASPIAPLRKAGRWAAGPRRERGQRKPYRRLTEDQIAQIVQMPVRWYRRQPPEGLIPLEDLARQFDVCPATLRNLVLRRSRLDLLARDASPESP